MELDVDMDTNIRNIACLSQIMSICNKQHLSNVWGSIQEKVNYTEAELKNVQFIKKTCNVTLSVFDSQYLNSTELLNFCKHFEKDW